MLIIGELINTSRPPIREAVEKRNAEYIQQIVKAEEEAGASYIDVNCGTFMDQEIPVMEWLVDTILPATKLPLCIDSPSADALRAGLVRYAAKNGQPMINSITDETPRWNAVLPLIKEFGAKIVALCIEDAGMPKTNEDRIRIADSIITKLTKEGVPVGDIYIDPLIKPLSAGEKNGLEVLQAIHKITGDHPGVHMTCGLSNISYSLPARKVLNKTFMIMTAACGMDSYILDPTNKDMRSAVVAASTLLGEDRFCRKFINGFRQGLFE